MDLRPAPEPIPMAYIVTEAPSDAALLDRVLAVAPGAGGKLGEVRVHAGGDQTAALSFARSLLIAKQKPVALVIDPETDDPEERGERMHEFEDLMRLGMPNVPHLVLAKPRLDPDASDEDLARLADLPLFRTLLAFLEAHRDYVH